MKIIETFLLMKEKTLLGLKYSSRLFQFPLLLQKVIGMSSTHAQDKRWHFQSKRIVSAGEIEYKNKWRTRPLGAEGSCKDE